VSFAFSLADCSALVCTRFASRSIQSSSSFCFAFLTCVASSFDFSLRIVAACREAEGGGAVPLSGEKGGNNSSARQQSIGRRAPTRRPTRRALRRVSPTDCARVRSAPRESGTALDALVATESVRERSLRDASVRVANLVEQRLALLGLLLRLRLCGRRQGESRRLVAVCLLRRARGGHRRGRRRRGRLALLDRGPLLQLALLDGDELLVGVILVDERRGEVALLLLRLGPSSPPALRHLESEVRTTTARGPLPRDDLAGRNKDT
jgi:hypothetical protein